MRRLVFAHQLRAIAACSVVYSHLFGVFWLMPDAVSAATRTPAPHAAPPAILPHLLFTWWEPGPFGVALFFLVSGLVIPLSFRDRGVGPFLLARIVRLWPTYAAALVLDVAIATAASHHFGQRYPIGAGPFLANLLLVPTYAGVFSIDLVNWSLGVEIRFYLVSAAIVALAGGIRPAIVLGTIVAIAVLERCWPVLPAAAHGVFGTAAFTEGVYLDFMLLGGLLAAHWSGRLSGPRTGLALALGAAASAASWRFGPLAPQFPIVSANYAEALVVFVSCYAARGRFRPWAPLDRLADISYPVYLLQSLVGYATLRVLMTGLGWSYGPALAAAVAAILVLATMLHVAIERPTMALSHRIGRHTPSPPRAA